MSKRKKAIVFGAHNDDPEYGAGGMTALLSERDWEVLYVCVAHKRRLFKKDAGTERERCYTNPAKLAEYRRQSLYSAELLGASKVFANKSDNKFYFWGDEEVRFLVDILEDFKPDIAFTHWVKDNHYEHVETAKITMLALSYCGIGCEVHAYEAGPWQSMVYFIPDFTVNITPVMGRVEESLLCYDQPSANGAGLVKEKKAAANLRGHMSGFTWGESFKVLRWPTGDPELILPKLFGRDYRWGGGTQYMWGDQYTF